MPLEGEASQRKEKFYRRNKGMSPLFGEMKEERISDFFPNFEKYQGISQGDKRGEV